ncbi:hypothetical protein GJ496_001964 [Pomphorhynchus laevis]|nr:hypothetical protein GJ496_001964 [Pomphorhynchus laevis]
MAAVCAYSIVKYGLFGYINELEKDGRWDAVEAPNPSVSLTRREFTFDAALKITTIQDSIMSQSGLQPFDIELPLVNGEPTLGIQAVVDMPPNGDIRFTILINTTAEDAATCAACSVFRYCQAPGTRVEPRAQQLLQTENDGSSRRCHKARHRPCNTTKNGQTPSYAPRSRGRRLRIFGGLLQCYNQEQGTL